MHAIADQRAHEHLLCWEFDQAICRDRDCLGPTKEALFDVGFTCVASPGTFSRVITPSTQSNLIPIMICFFLAEKKMKFASQDVSKTCCILFSAKFEQFSNLSRG